MKDNSQKPTIAYAGNPQQSPPTEYAAVFNTTTFGSLRRMDILGLGVSRDSLREVRALSYDRAIKFETPLWQDLTQNGGMSNTDL